MVPLSEFLFSIKRNVAVLLHYVLLSFLRSSIFTAAIIRINLYKNVKFSSSISNFTYKQHQHTSVLRTVQLLDARRHGTTFNNLFAWPTVEASPRIQ